MSFQKAVIFLNIFQALGNTLLYPNTFLTFIENGLSASSPSAPGHQDSATTSPTKDSHQHRRRRAPQAPRVQGKDRAGPLPHQGWRRRARIRRRRTHPEPAGRNHQAGTGRHRRQVSHPPRLRAAENEAPAEMYGASLPLMHK
ncbi:unnamed protein product [Ixodes pacificus]